MLQAPLVAEGGKCRAKARECAAGLPQAVELLIYPSQRSVPRPFGDTEDALQNSRAAHQRGHGTIVG